jgi:L-fuconolactonase
VIGWVPLYDPEVDKILASLKAESGGRFLKSIRHQVHDEADPGWLNRPEVMAGVRAVGRAGLVYDLLPKEPELPACIRCVAENPEMRFVVDHIAKPRIAAGEMEPWASLMRELASYPNVWCKISGMVTEAAMSSWQEDDFRPYVERALAFYGEDRVLFGSDWPVCVLAVDSYEAVHGLAQKLLSSLSPEARAKAFGINAQVLYGL